MTDTRKIVIHNVRLRYPRLFRAEVNKLNPNGKAAYSARIVMTADHPELDALKKFCVQKAEYKFGARAAKVMKEAKDSKTTRGLHYDDELGYVEFNAKRNEDKGPVLVVDRKLQDLHESDGVPQGGDWVNVAVSPYWYDNQSKGLAFELLSVQFVKKGEPFPGEGLSGTKDDFSALADDSDESEDKKLDDML